MSDQENHYGQPKVTRRDLIVALLFAVAFLYTRDCAVFAGIALVWVLLWVLGRILPNLLGAGAAARIGLGALFRAYLAHRREWKRRREEAALYDRPAGQATSEPSREELLRAARKRYEEIVRELQAAGLDETELSGALGQARAAFLREIERSL